MDPTVLLVTYSSDHNHPSPPPRNHRNSSGNAIISNSIAASKPDKESEPEPEDRFSDLGDGSLIAAADELGWLGEVEAMASPAVLGSPIFSEHEATVLGEEEESLFADLGELPECSVVFRRGVLLEREEEQRRRFACGTTG